MSKFAVLGPGAVGGFLAGALNYRSVPVTVIANERTASRIRTHGLHVTSETIGEFLTRPRAIDVLTDPVDVLLVTTRAYQLEKALERIQAPVGLMIPLISGLDHVGYLRQRFPSTRVCSASIRISVEQKGPGEVSHNSSFAVIDSAFDDEWLNHRELRQLVPQLSTGGVAMMVSSSEVQVMWSKLVFMNALSLASAITNMPVGWIRKDPTWRTKMQATLEEGAAVAQAEGAKVSVEMTMDYVDHARYELVSLMQRDLQSGTQPELDAISGSVLRAGARHGLMCPTIRELATEVAQKAGIPAPTA
jgi:2-dehydropantoate 2-reductase